jgi:antitoxin component YwqK of YwqJK toxin-antitoxin module
MRVLSILTILLCYVFLVNGQETSINQLDKNNEKTGSWIGYHEKTNTRRYTGNFLNGKPTGIFNYYALEGHLSAKVDFINDSVSSSEMYYDNAGLMAKGKFVNQMKEGKWFTYSRYGDILNVFNFRKGAMHGKQYLYYPANKETNEVKLMEEYDCENGLKNGKWKQYFKLGTVKSEGTYKMGKKDGVFIYYFSNGSIDMKGLFVNNLKHGPWLFYDGENDNMKKVNYNNGQIIEKNKNED